MKKERASQKNSAKSAEFFVYLGPTILGYVAHGAIYRGSEKEVHKLLSYAIERYPLIKTLLIRSDRLAEDRIKVKTPGNLLYVNYHKLLAGRK